MPVARPSFVGKPSSDRARMASVHLSTCWALTAMSAVPEVCAHQLFGTWSATVSIALPFIYNYILPVAGIGRAPST